MRAVFVLLAFTATTLVPAKAQLNGLSNWLGGSYLPPDNEPAPGGQCENTIQTTTIIDYQTTQVPQPITVARSQTAIAQAVVTVVQAVTTTMVQTESQQVQVPVTRTYEQVAQAIQTRIAEVPYQPPPVEQVVTETKVIASTQINENVETSYTEVVQPVAVTTTLVETAVSTAIATETQQEVVVSTTAFTPDPIVSNVVETRQDVRTEVSQLPDITSVVESVVVQTEESISYFTPPPIFNTQVTTETQVDTQVQPVLETQQVVVTQENTRTEVVQVTDNRIDYITSTVVISEVVTQTSTLVVDSVAFETSYVQEVAVSTQIVDDIDQRIVTSTAYTQVTDYQTVTGAVDVREEVVTITNNVPQYITLTVDNASQITVNKVVTAPCEQTKTGYNYNAPANPLVIG